MSAPGFKGISLQQSVYDDLMTVSEQLQAEIGTSLSASATINILVTKYLNERMSHASTTITKQ